MGVGRGKGEEVGRGQLAGERFVPLISVCFVVRNSLFELLRMVLRSMTLELDVYSSPKALGAISGWPHCIQDRQVARRAG